MTLRNTRDRWGAVAQGLHWLLAILIIAMVGLGLYMVELPLGVRMLELYALHKSIGVTILLLMAVRLAWRLTNPTPTPAGPMKAYERRLATAVHTLFYVVLFALPITGWLMSSAANFSVSVFGLFTLPDLVAPDKALEERFKAAHRWLGWVLIGLFVLHVAGALKHHVMDRDDTLRRMVPGWRPRG
ncbi:MAG: cytochrome b [Rhodospirillales bacterium]|nr:MAG: cytochrome b [Rhodospirillales bacterium]